MQSRTRQAAKHNTKSDCWVAVAAEVLKVTNFLPEHPGGEFAILTFAGEDARGACLLPAVGPAVGDEQAYPEESGAIRPRMDHAVMAVFFDVWQGMVSSPKSKERVYDPPWPRAW